MNKKGITLLFSDLEGTLLQESDRKCNSHNFYLFLDKINEFEKETNTKTIFNIVSPLEPRAMLDVIKKFRSLFGNYNRIHNTCYGINCAACEDNPNDFSRYPNYIFPCLSFRKSDNLSFYEIGKENFVKIIVESFQAKNNIDYCFYMGNDINDVKAMEYVNSVFKEKGIILCPENSKTMIKQNLQYFCGKGHDLAGIVDAFNQVTNKLFKEKNKEDDGIR